MTHWRYIPHTKYLKFFNNLNVKGLVAKKSTLPPYEKLNCALRVGSGVKTFC